MPPEPNPIDDDPDDEQLDDIEYKTQKEAVLFLIDVSDSMCAVDQETQTSHAHSAIECAYAFLTTKIITSAKDKVGIILYNTEQTHIPSSYGMTNVKNMYFLVDLDEPDVGPIKELRNLLEYEPDRYSAVVKPSHDKVSMKDVFFYGANIVFNGRAANFNMKRVIFITDNDDPCGGQKEMREAARVRAGDLRDLGITLESMFISGEDRPFRSNIFWDEIVTHNADEPLGVVELGRQRQRQMADIIKAKTVPRRAHFTVPLEIAPGLTIGVKGYILFKRQEIHRQELIHNKGDKPQIAKGEQQYIDMSTSKVLDRKEIRRGYNFGDSLVMFSEDDIKQVKHVEDPVIRIVGFKSLERLDFGHNMRPSYFIYPTEADYVGSTRTFASLHKNLLSMGRFALAWFIPRRNATPCMVAMLAAKEHIDRDTGLQDSPPGFHLVSLPFADDLRETPPQRLVQASRPLVDAFAAVIEQLNREPYDPLKFRNPSLQWHWKVLQAYALEEDAGDLKRDVDQTRPKYKGIEKRAGALIRRWGEVLEAESQGLIGGGATVVPVKRGRSGDDDPVKPQPKKTLTKYGDGEVPSLEEAGEMIADGKFEKLMTLQSLKAIIAAHPEQFKGRPASQRKADLVRFVEDALS